jgi:hypothetical protein
MPRQYRIADLELSRAGEHHVAVYSKVSTAAEVLPAEDAAMLRSCSSWLPLEEHARNWCRQQQLAPLHALSAGHGPRWAAWALKPLLRQAERRRESLPVNGRQFVQTKHRLQQLAQRGFLVAAESLIEDCRRHAAFATLPPIASIGITTRNRGGVLRRGLISHFENRRRYERSTDYVVIDDAADSESENRTRAELLHLRREFDLPIRYAGRAARRRFAAALSRESGAPPDLTEFALLGLPPCPLTTGAARNSLLLATAGDRFVMVDDDSVCRLTPCPASEPGMALNSRRDPTEFWFFPDPQSTLRETAFQETDFLGLHESLLGRDVGACLPQPEDFASLSLHAAAPAFDGRLRCWGGRVRASMAGVLGDSGIGSTGYLFVDAASQKRLTRSESGYLAAVGSRQVLRSVRRTTISEGTSCIAVNLGLDNRSLLPPFIPVQRNSDGLFARTLRLCFRDGYLGYLPWVVLHDPEHPRRQDLEDYWRHVRQLRTADWVIHLLQASGAPYDGSSDAGSLRRLGEQFEDWGSLDGIDFEELLRQQVWRSVGSVFSAQSKPEAPPAGEQFYARHRRKYADILRERVTERDYLLPSDLQPVAADEEVYALGREIIRRFGELLQAWPELYSAAARLRERGVELAPRLTEDEPGD